MFLGGAGMPASVEWVDRETFAYVVGSEKVQAWVDYEPGLLSQGRIIHTDSIQSWVSEDGTVIRSVSEAERAVVVSAIVEHLRSENHPCRTER